MHVTKTGITITITSLVMSKKLVVASWVGFLRPHPPEPLAQTYAVGQGGLVGGDRKRMLWNDNSK
jgi:hypothetical protein